MTVSLHFESFSEAVELSTNMAPQSVVVVVAVLLLLLHHPNKPSQTISKIQA